MHGHLSSAIFEVYRVAPWQPLRRRRLRCRPSVRHPWRASVTGRSFAGSSPSPTCWRTAWSSWCRSPRSRSSARSSTPPAAWSRWPTSSRMVAMLLTANSYAQMVRAFPMAGSVYNYAGRGIAPPVGFLAGWVDPARLRAGAGPALHRGGVSMNAVVTAIPVWIWLVVFVVRQHRHQLPRHQDHRPDRPDDVPGRRAGRPRPLADLLRGRPGRRARATASARPRRCSTATPSAGRWSSARSPSRCCPSSASTASRCSPRRTARRPGRSAARWPARCWSPARCSSSQTWVASMLVPNPDAVIDEGYAGDGFYDGGGGGRRRTGSTC